MLPHPAFRPLILMALGLALGATFSVPDARAGGKRISWRPDFQVGLQEAVLTRRPVLVNFMTSNCGWCRKLDNSTFKDREFVEAVDSLVPIRVDGDKERGLAAMFQVRAFPTTVILSRRGKELGRIVGYESAAEYLRAVYEAMGRREPLGEVQARANAAPGDPKALYALGDLYMAVGRYDEAAAALTRVLDLEQVKPTGLAPDAALDRAVARYLAGEFPKAIELFESYLEEFPGSDRRDQGLFFLGKALLKNGDRAAGVARMREAGRITEVDFIREQAALVDPE